jgi:hypothetical protein
LFLNLYYLRDSAFRDHNFSDFWNEGGGGEPIEPVPERRIVWYIRESYAPDPLRPGRLEGLPPDFQPIIPFTLSAACCDCFLRVHSALPIRPRDYYLSKLYQFLYITLAVRYWPQAEVLVDPVEVTAASEIQEVLQPVLEAIPDEQIQKFCTPEMEWWWNFYRDTLAQDFPTVLARIPEYIATVTTPATNRPMKMVTPAPPFPTPKGATWGDLTVRFTSDQRVQLTMGTQSETRNFAEMGCEDRRQELPDVAWEL